MDYPFIANYGDDTVTKLDRNGNSIGTYNTGGAPICITVSGDYVWITNNDDDTVTKIRCSDGQVIGTYSTSAGAFAAPRGICHDSYGNIWIANTLEYTLTKMDSDGNIVTEIGLDEDVGWNAYWVAADSNDNIWVVVDGACSKYDNDGNFLLNSIFSMWIPTPPEFSGDSMICIDSDDYLWIAEGYNHARGDNSLCRIRCSDGQNMGTFNLVNTNHYAVALDKDENLLISTPTGIYRYSNPDVVEMDHWTDGGSCRGIHIDSQGNIWLCDRDNNQVHKLSNSDLSLLGSFNVGDRPMNFGDFIYSEPVTPPVADFSGTPTEGTAPLTVQFTDESTNTPTSWSWNFGDGETSEEQNPTHIYTKAGTYTVTLTATNEGGSDDEVKTDYITVTSPVVAPVANFFAQPRSGKYPLQVHFTDLSE